MLPRRIPPRPAPDTPGLGRDWFLGYSLTWFAYWLLVMMPPQFMTPHLIGIIEPERKVGILSFLLILNAAVAVVCVPLAGMACDRTRSRFGRRRIWAAGGLVVGGVPFALVGSQDDWRVVAALMVLVSMGTSSFLVALSAVIADRVPPHRRGTASAAMGVPQVVAVVVGMVIVTMLVTSLGASWAVIALLAAVSAAPFLLGGRDRPAPAMQPGARMKAGEKVPFPRPREHPDYYWALASRVLINAGNGIGTAYLLYFLDDVLHREAPETSLLILTLVYLVFCAVSGFLSGRLSDRLGRRRELVALAGALQAVAALLLAIAPSWPTAIVSAVLLGIGLGAFLSVDQALVTDVLPDQRTRARDLGIINAAQNVPLYAAVGWAVLALLDDYQALYAAAALIMALGSVSVMRIRSVR